MDFCLNEQDQQVFSSSALTASNSPLDDLFPPQNMEVDVSLEWLSVFVEDCLTSPGNCLPPAAAPTTRSEVSQTSTTTPKPPKPKSLKNATNCLEKLFVVPGKARSKRKRVISAKITNPLTSWSYGHNQPFYFTSSDPPLLDQTHWLADSELIMPKNQTNPKNSMKTQEEQSINEEVMIRMSGEKNEEKGYVGNKENSGLLQQLQAPRRCTHCQSQRTPQWRAGPLGPKTLCNACGVRYKSGRLLPEYRPAKSPTFVSYLHSNSHKKVLEMRNVASTTTNTTATSPESSILS